MVSVCREGGALWLRQIVRSLSRSSIHEGYTLGGRGPLLILVIGSILDLAITSAAVRIVGWTDHLAHKGTINTGHERV